jgi:DNA-binding transcriptional MerR regulator
MTTRQRTDPESIAAAERAIQATRLRAAGLSYAEIAEACGYNSEQAAHKAVSSLLKRRKREAGDELLELIETRLDECLFAVYDRASGGSYAAIDRVLKIEKQRAELREPKGAKGKPGEGSEQPARAQIKIYIPSNGREQASKGAGETGGEGSGVD